MEEILHYSPWTIFLVPLVLLFVIARKRGASRKQPLPPGPWPIPILGNLLELGSNPHRSLAHLAQTYGPVMSLKLGCLYTIVVSSPSLAKEVLQTREHLSGRHVPYSVQTLGHHEVSMPCLPSNESWRYLRALVKTQLFSMGSLKATEQLRRLKVQELIVHIRGNEGRAMNIGQAAFCTMINLISTTFLSTDMADFNSGKSHVLKNLVSVLLEEAGRPNVSDFFPFLAPMDLQGRRRRCSNSIKRLYDFLDQMIEKRLSIQDQKVAGKPTDILDVLLQLSGEENSQLSRRMLRALLLDVVIGGSESNSVTVEWTIAEMLRQPDLMIKARAEITDVVGNDREVEESDMAKLPFLNALLKETLRLYPPAPLLLPHKAMADTEINGYRVPKNSQVLVNVWAIGRDEQIWVNPDTFLPERFLGGRDIDFRGHHFELIPFGSGRRICPGLPLSVRMMQLMLASFIQSFQWSLPEGMTPEELDMKEMTGLTLKRASPLIVIATPISKS